MWKWNGLSGMARLWSRAFCKTCFTAIAQEDCIFGRVSDWMTSGCAIGWWNFKYVSDIPTCPPLIGTSSSHRPSKETARRAKAARVSRSAPLPHAPPILKLGFPSVLTLTLRITFVSGTFFSLRCSQALRHGIPLSTSGVARIACKKPRWKPEKSTWMKCYALSVFASFRIGGCVGLTCPCWERQLPWVVKLLTSRWLFSGLELPHRSAMGL